MDNNPTNIDTYGYLNTDYGIALPQLVLAVNYYDADKIKFATDRKWLRIAHQTAGHGCHQHYLVGTILTMTPLAKELARILNMTWLESDCGVFGVSMNELENYRTQLRGYGLDCNFAYPKFEEAIYPVDCTGDALQKLAKDKLPKDLDTLIEFEGGIDKMCGMIGRWELFILGENCD